MASQYRGNTAPRHWTVEAIEQLLVELASARIELMVAHGWTPEDARDAWHEWHCSQAASAADRAVAEAAWDTRPWWPF